MEVYGLGTVLTQDFACTLNVSYAFIEWFLYHNVLFVVKNFHFTFTDQTDSVFLF